MSVVKSKNAWALLLMILAGLVLGGFIAELTKNVGWLSWLNFGQTFGLESPVILNLGIIIVTFALQIKITIGGIIGILMAILIYKLI